MHKSTPSSGFGSMKPIGRFALAALPLAAALAFGGAAAQGNSPGTESFAAGRILVMPRAGMPDGALAAILKEHGGGKARRVGQSELRIVDLPPGLEKQSVEKLARHPHIEFAELDEIVPLGASNDPYFGSQWHLPKTRDDAAWSISAGEGVTIAILDTGVDVSHPDLKDRMVAGYNFYNGNSDSSDVYGHGTAVAGTAAASLNNGTGVASPAGAAWIMPLRISAADGSASYSTMATALNWAADKGARIANLSYQKACGSASVQSAANYMRSKGGLVVVSAGNSGVQEAFAASDALICVSATDASDSRASWSSYGAYVDVAAPGAGIYTTTRGGGYGAWNGTSFSSPLTAGILAQMMSANPSLPAGDVQQLLYSTAVDLGASGADTQYGKGRVDAYAAVQAALNATTFVDAQVPSAAIVNLVASSTVSGLVAVDVSASDNKGVVRVDLLFNGSKVGSDSTAPFAFSWDSSKVPNGMAELKAVAVDAAGNAGTSAGVSVNVSNAPVSMVSDTTPPTVGVSNPGNGSTVTGTVSIKVNASDNLGTAGISQVLYINGKQVASASGGSLSYGWNTRKAKPGTYTIQATARDAAGNTSSDTVTVQR
jgi:subtilisin family serine protease